MMNCKRCEKELDDFSAVTVIVGDNLKTYILCKDCIEILDMFMNSEAPYNV